MKRDRSNTSGAAEIVSEPVVYPSRCGLKIAAYWDHRREGYEKCPFVVMSPKYGETKKNNLQLAYHLAANGLNVLRFDHTSHVGESAGIKTSFTLAGSVHDIQGSLDYVENRFKVSTVTLLASSLSARSAVRATALDARVGHLVCIVGVLNVQATLAAVFCEDVIGNYIAGKRWNAVDNILGCDSDLDLFFGSTSEEGLHDLAGSVTDMAAIKVPVVFFSGDNDAWVDIGEVRSALSHAPKGRVELLAGAKHEVRENQSVADVAFKRVVATILQEAWGLDEPPTQLTTPDKRGVLAQNRIERESLQRAEPRAQSEEAFWTDYLGKYVMLEHVDDYASYVKLLGELVSPITPGELILDAGCGNGMFGAYLLQSMRKGEGAEAPAMYVGLDLTDRGLDDALTRHVALQTARIGGEARAAGGSLGTAYARANFDGFDETGANPRMPQFADATFDGICCSLVLSYLANPLVLLRELRRIIKPGGRIVISSMKPHCDISVIYREFVDAHADVPAMQSARVLLSGVGQIKIKEDQGYYVFFSGEELAAMLTEAGFARVQSFVSFGDQAHVAKAQA